MVLRRAKSLTRRKDGPRLIEALHALYSLPQWALFPEVRSRLGIASTEPGYDVLRVADAIAIEDATIEDVARLVQIVQRRTRGAA